MGHEGQKLVAKVRGYDSTLFASLHTSCWTNLKTGSLFMFQVPPRSAILQSFPKTDPIPSTSTRMIHGSGHARTNITKL